MYYTPYKFESMLSEKEKMLLEQIERVVSLNGRYPSYGELMNLMDYKSKRSISVLVDSLVEKGYLRKNVDSKIRLVNNIRLNESIDTVDIPLLGDVACGAPIFADENIEAVFAISTQIAHTDNRYFLLRAIGDSMNNPPRHKKAINDGDLVLVKSQSYAEDGDWVLAIINNEGTIKEFRKLENHIVLIPHSDKEKYKPILVSKDLRIQGVVSDVFKGLDKLNF